MDIINNVDIMLHEGNHGILTRHHHNKNNPRGNYRPLGGGNEPDDDDYNDSDKNERKDGSEVRNKIISAVIVIVSLSCYIVWEFGQL
ncbi:hypothetical protein LIT25_26700 (plasmid) [Bacillus sp. F19]|nr:hypothetical protein LIT25_26700 [Bacillus sp. F19]